YHLGARVMARSSPARPNQQQPYGLDDAVFAELHGRWPSQGPHNGVLFKKPPFFLDASLVDLSVPEFPGPASPLAQAARKLHVGLDHAGHLPAFATITEGKTADIEIGRALRWPKASVLVFDKGYVDYQWFKQLDHNGLFFVTRLRQNATYRVLERRAVDRSS